MIRFSLLAAFLLVVGLGLVLAQQPNVAVRESASEATRIAVIEERLRGIEQAIALQAAKYEDRLQALNHAHDKQVADQATYLGKEVFDATRKDIEGKLASLDQRTTIIESRTAGASSFRDTSLSVIASLLALALAAYTLLSRRRNNSAEK